MIARSWLVAFATLATTTGCIRAQDEEWSSFEMAELGIEPYVDFGTIEIVSLEVEREWTLPTEVGARIEVVVRTDNARSPWIEIVLDDEACSRTGPPTEPTTRVAGVYRVLPDDGLVHEHTIRTTLRGSTSPGLDGSVYVGAEASNAIGPIFGECRDFARAP